ncbi:MAG: PKD domain-containing protein, partial [Chloroflexi bacterium]|nr:PKD domain-containing protein [Chloroflexota bacterium]
LTPSHVFDQPGIYTVTLVVTDDDGGVGTDTLEVEVQQATPPVEPDLPAEADLSIAKSASPDPATSGKPLAYTILVQNHGPSDATGVLVTDALPAGVAYDPSQSSQQCAEAGAVIVCDVGDLAVNASVELVIAVNVPITTVGTLVNAAEVSANEPDPDSDNNEAIVQVEAALPEIALVNGALEQIGLQTSYNPSDGRAPAGVFRITVAWRNVSAFGYFDMHAEVVILTGGNLLLNADGGPGGVGAIASVADAALGGDGLLTPGETFTQTYEIGLAVRQQFSFFVNVYGRDP